MLRIFLFGQLRLVVDGAPHPLRGLPKTLPLLAFLLLHRKQAFSRERLAFTFWPDESEDVARANLRRHLHDLRRALPAPTDEDWLLVDSKSVQWNPRAAFWLDVAEFERLSAAPETLAAAAPLYADDLLPEVYDDWIYFERERLRELLFDGLDRLVGRYEAAGDLGRAIDYAVQMVRRDPLREETARQLMALHYRAGDRYAALQEFRRIERALRDDLDVPPMPETTALYQSLVQGAPLPAADRRVPAQAALPPPSNLPAPVTPFVGRQEELARLRMLLVPGGADQAHEPPFRLLTITGAGGSGKTRLSLELAASILKEPPSPFPDGVWFVSLSLITDPALVIPSIADVLQVEETTRASLFDDVVQFLRHKRLLLLLDNFEHVTDAAGLVAALLAAAPGLSIVVTSRAVLRLYGEYEYPLDPLPLPDPVHLPPPAELARNPAVALFVERARAAAPGFTLTPQNAAAVTEICMRLDGLPLAIELAAARARLFAPAAMLERLESRLPFLAGRSRNLPIRQTTLRAAIDWSYTLLSPAERALFDRLSVFVGGFTASAAVQVADGGDESDMLERLAGLADQSMLRILPADEGAAEPRFRMLTLLREYAGEHLAGQGELDAIRRRHAETFLALAKQGDHELRGPAQLAALRRLEADHDNLRAAMAWSLDQPGPDACLGLALAAALGWFWYLRDFRHEGNDWLVRAMAAAPDASPRVMAHAAKARGIMLSALGRFEEAISLIQRSLDLFALESDAIGQGDALVWLGRAEFRQKRYATAVAFSMEAAAILQAAGDRYGESLALRNAGDAFRLSGRFEEAERQYRQALALGHASGGGWAVAMSLNSMGELLRLLGRYAQAVDVYDEDVGLQRIFGNRSELATALHNQGHVTLRLGDPARANRQFRESLDLYQSLERRRGVCLCWAGLAGVAAQTGQAERAAQLLAAVGVHLKPLGAHLMGPADQAEYDWHLATARAALDADKFALAWEAGRSLAFEQVADLL
jgi:predicted ATPase/DNA-binding SARP family transcriptional activator